MKAVWPNVVVEENNLNQAISALRKATDLMPRSRDVRSGGLRGWYTIRSSLSSSRSIPVIARSLRDSNRRCALLASNPKA
jgi:6-phosphogluconate dehydrogenase (decarboxylating)